MADQLLDLWLVLSRAHPIFKFSPLLFSKFFFSFFYVSVTLSPKSTSITSFCLLSAMFVYCRVAYDLARVHILRVKSLVVGG